MPTAKSLLERRMGRGESNACARAHHATCPTPDNCTCKCHADPQAFEQQQATYQESARKAWETRRAGGKAPASSTGTPAETPPKRPEIKTGVKPAIPAAAARQIKSEFAFVVWCGDQAAASFRPQQWITPDDRLNGQEITALTNATYNEIEARAPWLLKLLATAQQSAPEAALIYTVAMIALPRLARHGATIAGLKITPELANAVAIAPFLAAQVQQQGGAAGVGAEPTPESDRPDRYGQVDVGGAPAQGPQVRAGAAQQAGFGQVSDGPGDPHSARNGRHET